VDLLVAGLVRALTDSQGRETLQLTEHGLQALAESHANHRVSLRAHEALVLKVARRMQQEGRIAWTGLPLRAQVDDAWVQAIPDVFSVRNTTVEAYLEPVVHEIKVSRADFLGDIKQAHKRAAYLAMASQVYYVLGANSKAQPIAEADEVPAECGVIQVCADRLDVVRVAPKHAFSGLRFDVWMALAKAAPLAPDDDGRQLLL